MYHENLKSALVLYDSAIEANSLKLAAPTVGDPYEIRPIQVYLLEFAVLAQL